MYLRELPWLTSRLSRVNQPQFRKAPGDSLIGGSRVVSDTLTAKVTTNPGETFIDQMIKMVESSKRPKTPNEVAITMVLIGLTAIFTIIIVALLGMSVTLGLGADFLC